MMIFFEHVELFSRVKCLFLQHAIKLIEQKSVRFKTLNKIRFRESIVSKAVSPIVPLKTNYTPYKSMTLKATNAYWPLEKRKIG